MANIGLKDAGGPLLEKLPESPFEIHALARGQGDDGLLGDLSHDIKVEALDHLLTEP